MPVTVNVNGLSMVHTDSGGEANATLPDVCKKTVGPSVVEVSYPNQAFSKDLEKGSKTVTADGGNSIAIEGSIYAKSTGDEAGDQKGVVSGTIQAEAKFISFSPDVTIEGKGVCRLSDKMLMNKGNTACLAGTQNEEVQTGEIEELEIQEKELEDIVYIKSKLLFEGEPLAFEKAQVFFENGTSYFIQTNARGEFFRPRTCEEDYTIVLDSITHRVTSQIDYSCNSKNNYSLKKPFLIAKATNSYAINENKLTKFQLQDSILGGTHEIPFGQDITHSLNRKHPENYSVGDSKRDLKEKMKELLDEFASGDKTGVTKDLFKTFLKEKPHKFEVAISSLNKNEKIAVFEDPRLTKKVEEHENIKSFIELSLAAPSTEGTNPKKIRIHQSLKKVNWNINKLLNQPPLDDLQTPAVNKGNPFFSTKDYETGLGVMINAFHYALIYVTEYFYDSTQEKYEIELTFVLYDVFGLDDHDVVEYGAKNIWNLSDKQKGITAWWQLQHQFDYAPVITKIILKKKFTISTK